MHTTPISLLERLRNPDEDSWGEFVRLYTPLLYAWARRAGVQEADAADLIQDVLMLLIAKLPEFRYDADRSFRGWLRTVTLNKLREQHRRAALPLAHDVTPADLPVSDAAEAFWETEYRQHLVGQALQLMRVEFQATTWQACWEHLALGRPASEVGVELGLTAGAVRAATFRVLARLRQKLAGLMD